MKLFIFFFYISHVNDNVTSASCLHTENAPRNAFTSGKNAKFIYTFMHIVVGLEQLARNC